MILSWSFFITARFRDGRFSEKSGVSQTCKTLFKQFRQLFQLRVFRLGSNQNGDVRVGVFPHREEVLIGSAGFGAVALESVGVSKAKLGHGIEGANDV